MGEQQRMDWHEAEESKDAANMLMGLKLLKFYTVSADFPGTGRYWSDTASSLL